MGEPVCLRTSIQVEGAAGDKVPCHKHAPADYKGRFLLENQPTTPSAF